MRDTYDVVVIGSGFGGAVMGARLAQGGRSVCILERGRRWDKRQFPRSMGQVRDGIWLEGKSYGFIEYKAFERIDVVQGTGVGGGSLHYFNVHLRTPKEIFARPEWPAGIKRNVMDPYYDLIMDMQRSKPLVAPRGFKMPPRTNQFMAAAEAAGRKPELVPIAVHTGEVGPNAQGVVQEPCDYGGDCLIGCRIHAKNSLDITYIPLGEKHGAEVFPLHSVQKIEPVSSGGYRVTFHRLDPDSPGKYETGSVIGKKVVIAAGALGSTELLLRCRDVHKTLPKLPASLGRRFSGNGDMLFAGTMETRGYIDPGQGPSITAGADFSRKGSKHRIYIEDLGFPNPFLWLLEGMIPSPARIWGMKRAATSYMGAALGMHKPGQSRMAFEIDQLFADTFSSHFLPYLGMGTDAADGVLELGTDGAINVAWDPAASMEMFLEMEQSLKEISTAAGGKYVESFLWSWPFRRLLTAHPLGGCIMSDREDAGVVNDRGEVFGHPDLYVADSGIIPGALSVNPSMTIGALSERIAYHVLHARELSGNATTPTNS
ncbi:MAG TPA: GMC oxidoreductase [Polyangium sp.]|nr:GMC oxidoreductase [Polyangium sp.]